MNAACAPGTIGRRLRALGIMPLRLRNGARDAGRLAESPAGLAPVAGPVVEAVQVATPAPALRIRRLALLTDPAERRDSAINKMYMALTEAVAKVGLQSVRVCDVAEDPTAALMVFGALPLPDGMPANRVLHVETLAALHADRQRKRALWERLQAMGQESAG